MRRGAGRESRGRSGAWPGWALGGMLPLVRRGLRRNFLGVWCDRLPLVDERAAGGRPLLLCASHTNWWDGFVAAWISCRALPGRRLAMMQEERHLRKYPFFRAAGVFGIDLDGSPTGGLREALRRLARPDCALWMFPQGRFQRADEPVSIRDGAAWLAHRGGALIVPVWIHYAWLFESKPAVAVLAGDPVGADEASSLAGRLDALRQTVIDHDRLAACHEVLPRRLSLNKVWERWAGRLGLAGSRDPFDDWNR